MTPDDLSKAISDGLVNGGQMWIIQTAVAMLPAFWVLTLALILSRPYMIRMLHKFTLRFGADIWWLSYVLLRDSIMLITFALGIVFFYPNLVKGNALPLTGSLATALLLVALAVKLTRDADDNANDFRLTTGLILLSSALYLVPQVFGVESADQNSFVASFLTTNSNLDWAVPILYVSYIILIATGVYLFTSVTFHRTAAPASRRPSPPTRVIETPRPQTV